MERQSAPFLILVLCWLSACGILGGLCLSSHTGSDLGKFLGCSLAAVKDNILNELKQVGGDIAVSNLSGRVDNAEVHAVGCGMI